MVDARLQFEYCEESLVTPMLAVHQSDLPRPFGWGYALPIEEECR